MKPIIISFFLLSSFIAIAQPHGVTTELITKNKISKIEATLDLEDDDPKYENLVVGNYEFDDKGRCTRKKIISPFYDVVATSNETIFEYLGLYLVRETRIHKTEAITAQDKEYIGLFGATNDTTIVIKMLTNDGKLDSKSEYTHNKDTFHIYYKYEGDNLSRTTHLTSKASGKLHPGDYLKTYYYDSLNRLIEEQRLYKSLDLPTVTSFKYDGYSQNLIRKLKTYDIRWLNVYKNGVHNLEFEMDSTFGKMEIFQYDSDNNLTKETTYLNLLDTTSRYHWVEYQYEGNLMISRKSYSNTDELINLTDEIRYEYDKRGLLKKEVFVYNGKTAYSIIYDYK